MKHASNNAGRDGKGLLVALGIAILVAAAVFYALNFFDEGKSSENDSPEPVTTEATHSNLDGLSGEDVIQSVEGDRIAVEAAYMTLYYPAEWEGFIRAEEQVVDVSSTVVFYGQIGDKEVALYAIYFAGSSGLPVGSLATAGGFGIDVCVEMSDFAPGGEWTQEEIDRYWAMQETLNYVIQAMTENPSFETVQ